MKGRHNRRIHEKREGGRKSKMRQDKSDDAEREVGKIGKNKGRLEDK